MEDLINMDVIWAEAQRLADESGEDVTETLWIAGEGLILNAIHEDGISYAYRPRRLTPVDVARAAEVVAAIAAIPSLQGGFVEFDQGLRGGYWYCGEDHGGYVRAARVAMPQSGASIGDCRIAVMEAIEVAREEMQGFEDVDGGASLRALEMA